MIKAKKPLKLPRKIPKQGFVELYTQRLKEKNINTKHLRTPKAETPWAEALWAEAP